MGKTQLTPRGGGNEHFYKAVSGVSKKRQLGVLTSAYSDGGGGEKLRDSGKVQSMEGRPERSVIRAREVQNIT